MSEEEIINLHREVFEYLMEKRKENPELYFTLNTNVSGLMSGKYFHSYDNNDIKFSFWSSPGVFFYVNKQQLIFSVSFHSTYSEEVNRRLNDSMEKKSASNYEKIYSHANSNWEEGLDFFFENDKKIIDAYFSEKFEKNFDIKPEQFNYWLKQVEHFAQKRRKHKPSSDFKLNPKIRLSSLTLKNIGHFSDISLDLSKNVTILIGENGSGKSTLLRSIALAITGLNAFDLDKDYSKEKNEIINHFLKIESFKDALPIYAEKGEISLQLSPNINLHLAFAPSPLVSGKVEAEEIDANERTKIFQNPRFLKQTVIGFSQGEKIISSNLKTEPNEVPLMTDLFPLISNSTTNYLVGLEEWLHYFIHEKNDSETVEKLFTIISKIVNDSEGYVIKLKQPYKTEGVIGFEGGEKSIIVCTPDAPNGIQLGLVSQGYQNIFRFISGLIIKLKTVKDYFFDDKSLTEIPAIVLIDEIDTYLHPKWQANILKVLVEEFPNVQFVVTTHSPLVVSNLSIKDIQEELENGETLTVKGVDFAIYEIEKSSESGNVECSKFDFREFYPFASKTTRTLKYMNVLERPEIVRLKFERLDKYVANLNQDKSLFQKTEDLLAELKGIIDPFDEDLLRYETTLKTKKKLFL